MKMHIPSRSVAVRTLLLLLGVFTGVAAAQNVTITNRPLAGTVGIQYSFQFLTSPSGTYTYSCNCTPAPGLSLSASGAITGTPTTVGSFNFTVTATDPTNSANTSGPVAMSIRIGAQPLTIVTTSVPAGVAGGVYSFALTASGGSGTYAWTLFSGSLPPNLTLSSSGVISGITTTAGNYSFRVQVNDSSSSVASQPYAFGVIYPNMVLSPNSFPAGIVNGSYSQTLSTTGGDGGPYTYSLSSGSLPTGVVLSPTGLVSGSPSAAGTFSFAISVSDGSTFTPNFTPKSYSIQVYPQLVLSSSGSGFTADAAAAYSQTFSATGGTGAGYSYSIGSTPSGLTFNRTSGVLSGIPTAGSYPFTVTATDGGGFSASTGYTLTVNPAPGLSPTSVPSGQVGTLYSQTFSATGGSGGYTYSFSGTMPGGLAFNAGVLGGTPTASGTFPFSVTARDSLGSQATNQYTLSIANPPIVVGPTSIASGQVGSSYSQTFTATGGNNGPYTFSVSASTLFGLNFASPTLSGTPTSYGTTSVTVSATDGTLTGRQTYTLTVAPPPLTLSPTSVPSGQAGTPYSQSFTASGGAGGYSYSFGGTMPAGLGFNAGVLSGTPTAGGTFPFSVTVKDSLGTQTTNQYNLSIANPPIVVGPGSITSGQVGSPYSQTFTATGGNSGPYTFSVSASTLFGLAFSSATLSGTPTSYGSTTITVSATDGTLTGRQTYTLAVAPPPLTLSPSSLSNGIVGTRYSQSFTAGGGVGSYTIALTSTAPAGLSFSASGATATLSGTPTNYGAFPVTLQVTDGTSTPLTRSYTLAISPPAMVITTTSLPGSSQNAPYNQTLGVIGGAPPYSWTSANLPTGLTLSSTGAISGSFSGAGTFTFTVTVSDASNATASATFTVTVLAPPLFITTTSPLPPAVSGANYSAGLSASGGVPPYTFLLNSGPPGLSLQGSSLAGKLTNLTAAPITYNVSIQVRDSAGATAGATLTITVQPAAAGIVLSAGSLAFAAVAGGAPPSPQYVSASSTTSATPAFTVASNQSWLSASPASGNAPATLQIRVNPASLSAGTYSGIVTLTGPDGAHSVGVSLKVTAVAPHLSVAPTIVSFASDGISQPAPGGIQISNSGNGNLTYSATVANGSSWISLGSAPATVSAGSPVSLPVSVSVAGLRSGDYRDVVHITSDSGTADVPITLLVASASTINLAPAGALFSSREDQGIANGTRTFSILTTGTNSVAWTASLPDTAPWLTLNTTAGVSSSTSPGIVSYSVNPATLTSANYYARIRITAPSTTNAPLDFLVVASVAPETSPVLPDPFPAGLLFISQPGSPVPPAQSIVVNTSSQTTVNYSTAANTASGVPWLAVGQPSGTTSSAVPGQVTATINPGSLPPGIYQGGISISLAGNPSAVRTVNVVCLITGNGQSSSSVAGATPFVTSRVTPDAGSSCSPSKLVALQTGLVSNFQTPAGWPTPLAIQLVNDCGSPVTSGQVVATFSNGDAPLALQLSDNKNAVYSATWSPHGTSNQVTVTARATAPSLSATTSQIIGAVAPNQVPILFRHGTIHNMNPLPGASLAPGTIVQIYGSGLAPTTQQTALPLPTNVNGTIVIIGGYQAPLYYVSDGQLNAQLPLELTAGHQYQVLISANGALTTPDAIDIEPATPGVAALANGAVIAQHADTSYVTAASPAHPGETLTIYLAGMGLTDVTVKTGDAAPSSPLAHPNVVPTVTVDGENAAVSFSGLTPQAVGLYQINFQVPADAPSGNLQLLVDQAGTASNASTLPVQP